jgi:hypothetical protein
MNNFEEAKEREIQKFLHLLISDPSKVFRTQSGKRLQFLSPGRLNSNEGPDFLEIALLVNGFVVVGDCEFHKKSSDWLAHSHSTDFRYDNVILHIILVDDKKLNQNFETLQISTDELNKFITNSKKSDSKDSETNIFSIEELQNYALLRLLRKTNHARNFIEKYGSGEAIKSFSSEFVLSYDAKKHRPSYNQARLTRLIEFINDSHIPEFITRIENGEQVSISDMMQLLIKNKIMDEGPSLRRELILNSILPLAISIANEESRVNLFLWYWSTPALNQYGILKRRFPQIPQNFLWQQQGMLEYIKEKGTYSNIVSEALKEYGFFETLSFYKLGRMPLEFYNQPEDF